MKKYKKNPIYGGAYINESGELCVNTHKDRLHRDIVLYNQNTSGKQVVNGVPIIYAYQYNPRCQNMQLPAFRRKLKQLACKHGLDEFIETGVLRINEYIPLDSINVIIRVKPKSHPSVLDTMFVYLMEYIHNRPITLELIKRTCENVKFNRSAAYKALREAGYSVEDANAHADSVQLLFDHFKSNNMLFEMKRFSPRAVRSSFTDFLIFGSDEEKATYESLQGANVLIYDDFLTSGATLKEANRYLKSINPSNTLTCFVLIQQ